MNYDCLRSNMFSRRLKPRTMKGIYKIIAGGLTMQKLEGKVALITGGGTGIGKAIAILFAENGADIAICGRRMEQLERTRLEILSSGRRCIAIQGDISKEEDVVRIVKLTIETFGRLDILVNNASIVGQVAPVKDIEIGQWEETLRVNLTGAMLCCREAVKHMIRQRSGNIINVASNVGKRGYPNRAPYVCSKWAMLGLTQTLALEVAEYGIRVNAICPGAVMTDRLRAAAENMAKAQGITFDEWVKKEAAQSPMKRFATAEECAKVALFLASDDSSAMTGQALNVTAGAMMS